MNASLLRTLALASVAAISVAGCGDGPTCQLEKLVWITSPQGPVIADGDPQADGVQQDVTVKSTFFAADVTLTVVDRDGEEVASLTARTDDDGNATFADVTIPVGGATLRVEADGGECGSDDDEVTVALVGGGDCALAFATEPVANDFYAPLGVWHAADDADSAAAGFQTDTIVRARPGEQVRLLLSAPGVPESEIGAGTIGDTGELSLAITAPEGQVNLRAECGVTDALGARSSGVTSVFVDTVAPTCTLVAPTPGTSITPGLDANSDPDDGIQLALRGNASGNDGAGEAATFTITAPGGMTTTAIGTDLSSTGDSTADATFDPATSPATYGVRFATRDHADNQCETTQSYRVVLAGCTLTVTAPTATVTADADGDSSNGAQVDVVVSSPECAGRTVTSDCGSDDPGAMLDGAGAGTLRATMCDSAPCESSELCTLRVTSSDGIETTAGVDLRFDNLAPSVAIAVAQPAGVACAGTVTPAQDVDAATAGVQLRMRVTSPSAVSKELDVTSGAATTTLPVTAPTSEVVATIVPGANTFLGRGIDAAGNIGTSTSCVVSLADIAVNFTGSPADGTVGGGDGVVAAGQLTFTLTGTVSVLGATVEITVDGGAPIPAVVTGSTWSVPLTLAGRAAAYAIVATATQGTRTGSATLPLVVDLTAPSAPSGLVATADTRQSIRLDFTAPGGAASYRVKFATTALTDGNFDSTGTAVTGPTPGAAGAAELARVRPLRAGTAYWVGVASVDAAGNRSVAQIAGPLTPRFDQAAVTAAPNTAGNVAFGLAMARGRFNDDAFDDVAIGAPYATVGTTIGAGEVYVYFGSATGLPATPNVTLRGATTDGNLGASLTSVRWSSTVRSDLVIGEPGADGFNGAVHVVSGGAAFPTGAVAITAAQRRIGVATTANWFSGSALGWQVAAADHDGDGTDDLIATAVFGAAGASGAAVVLYGGTVPTGNVRISDTSAAGSGTAVIRMYEDPDLTGSLFGYYLHTVGRTGGLGDATDDLAVAYAEDGLANATVVVYRGAGRPAAPGVTREPFTVGRDVKVQEITVDVSLEWGSVVGSIADQNGDGARELVFGDYRFLSDTGIVLIIDGDTVGTAGVARSDAPGVALRTFVGANPGDHLGMAVVTDAAGVSPDVDGDGTEDLIVASRSPGTTQAVLDVRFGPTLAAAPDHTVTGPAGFQGTTPTNGGSPITAIVAGDVNADGLADVCWADWTSAGLDGGMQLAWDDGL